MKHTPQNCQDMAQIREAIDELDRELVKMLRLRVDYIERAAEIKKQIGWPARIDKRVEDVAMNARKNAMDFGGRP